MRVSQLSIHIQVDILEHVNLIKYIYSRFSAVKFAEILTSLKQVNNVLILFIRSVWSFYRIRHRGSN